MKLSLHFSNSSMHALVQKSSHYMGTNFVLNTSKRLWEKVGSNEILCLGVNVVLFDTIFLKLI
jgi:hypothetical protein